MINKYTNLIYAGKYLYLAVKNRTTKISENVATFDSDIMSGWPQMSKSVRYRMLNKADEL